MDKLQFAKKAISLVVSIGAGAIATQIIQNNSAPRSLIQKVTMTAGAGALGGLVAAAAAKYVEEQFDEMVDWWNKNVIKD